MHREPLLALLRAHRPADAHEAEMTDRVVAFVRSEPRCFDRGLAVGHVTGSAFVVDRERRHTLLLHHRKLGRWLQPGGHADGDPDVLAVALREAREETGLSSIRPVSSAVLDVDVHRIPARGEEPEHLHHDVRFLLEADRSLPLDPSAESTGLRWVELDRVDELTDEESVLRMVRKAAALRDAPA